MATSVEQNDLTKSQVQEAVKKMSLMEWLQSIPSMVTGLINEAKQSNADDSKGSSLSQKKFIVIRLLAGLFSVYFTIWPAIIGGVLMIYGPKQLNLFLYGFDQIIKGATEHQGMEQVKLVAILVGIVSLWLQIPYLGELYWFLSSAMSFKVGADLGKHLSPKHTSEKCEKKKE